MNLQDIRDAVREQLEVDEEELPNSLIDLYTREAYTRTINVETRWPFFQSDWEVVVTPGEPSIALPPDMLVPEIASVIVAETGVPIVQIEHTFARLQFANAATSTWDPHWYSLWGDRMFLWPRGDRDITLYIDGYRKPSDWVSAGASSEVDADERLHILLIHYVIALAYAQQEDEVLEDVYMKRWNQNLNVIAQAIMAPAHQRPVVLNQGLRGAMGRRGGVAWNLDGV